MLFQSLISTKLPLDIKKVRYEQRANSVNKEIKFEYIVPKIDLDSEKQVYFSDNFKTEKEKELKKPINIKLNSPTENITEKKNQHKIEYPKRDHKVHEYLPKQNVRN